MNATARRYSRYAAALLALTLLAGLWLRAMMTVPGLPAPVRGPWLLHAHSHGGFFGWAAMGAFAVVTSRIRLGATSQAAHLVLAHLTGIASFAAFIGFALRGYDMVTIPLSAAHVVLWFTFVALVWRPLRELPALERCLLRGALAFLVVAGLGTIAPVMVMVRGVSDPWLEPFSVKLFLTPFVSGFLVLLAAGVLAGRRLLSGAALPALGLIAAGTLPSTVLYVSATPPSDAWLLAGRWGIGASGAGLLLLATSARRTLPRLAPLDMLALLSLAAAGALQLLASAGVGAAFMHSRGLVIAVLHLVLLGVVTPAFLLGMRPDLRAPRLSAAYACGLLLMTGSLALSAWPWAARQLFDAGVGFDTLLRLALAGGALAAAALARLAGATLRPRAATPLSVARDVRKPPGVRAVA